MALSRLYVLFQRTKAARFRVRQNKIPMVRDGFGPMYKIKLAEPTRMTLVGLPPL
jgi:hypothetical protein